MGGSTNDTRLAEVKRHFLVSQEIAETKFIDIFCTNVG